MTIPFTLTREKRKSISLRVSDQGEVVVKAPSYVSESQVAEFVVSKSQWIQKKLSTVMDYTQEIYELLGEGKILLLGSIAQIQVKPGTARVQSKRLITIPSLEVSNQEIIHSIHQALKPYAKEYLSWLVSEVSTLMGVRPQGLRIKDNSTNWGSASTKKNLNFNWRIIMAPPEIIRYLVVHELAHLKHMNHSERFWSFVEQFDPEYQLHDEWLKKNGTALKIL